MTFRRTASIRRFVLLAPVLGTLGLMSAQGAVTLLIDTQTKTYSWSGSFTSDPFTLSSFTYRQFRIGIGNWSGGDATSQWSPISVINTEVSGSGNSRLDSYSEAGRLIIQPTLRSIYTSLGTVYNEGFDPEFPHATYILNVAASGQASSYSGLAEETITYLEALDGTVLYFQEQDGILTDRGVAGAVSVIPEPSSALLGLAASVVLMRRRRERTC